MKTALAACFAAVLLLTGCSGDQQPAVEAAPEIAASEALHALFDEHFEATLELNPIRATFIGDDRYNDRIANSIGKEHIAKSLELDKQYLAKLLEIDRAKLDYQDQLSYDLFRINRDTRFSPDKTPYKTNV